MPDQTPALDDFRRAYETNPKKWWLLDCGHHMNLFDEALDRIDEAREWAAWFAAERDYILQARAQESAVSIEAGLRDHARMNELRARITELEATPAEPDAYIAVKRNRYAEAAPAEWHWDAAVIPAGEHHAWDRAEHEKRGYELLPIVATETGTRPATPQPDPAGYVVVTRNSEGGVHRSATVWESLDQARAAEGVQAGYADGTGCTAGVYALQEVNGDAE